MSRQHTVTIDVGVWDGGDGYDYRLTVTVHEARLEASAALARAISRHDGRSDLAGGGIVIEAKRIGKSPEPLFLKESEHAK